MQSRNDLYRLAAAMGGVPILGCLDGSPAALAGVRYGDILLAIDGTPTRNWDDFLEARSRCKEGFVARIFRGGEEFEVSIRLRAATQNPMDVLGELVARDILVSAPRNEQD
jgi:S1-C subfamily serine protease